MAGASYILSAAGLLEGTIRPLASANVNRPSVTFGYEEEDGTLRITQLPMTEFDPAAGMSSEPQDGERLRFEESNRLASEPVPESRHEQ